MAIVLGGSRFGTGDRGPDWGELGCLGGVVARCLGLWGWGVVPLSKQCVPVNTSPRGGVAPLQGL